MQDLYVTMYFNLQSWAASPVFFPQQALRNLSALRFTVHPAKTSWHMLQVAQQWLKQSCAEVSHGGVNVLICPKHYLLSTSFKNYLEIWYIKIYLKNCTWKQCHGVGSNFLCYKMQWQEKKAKARENKHVQIAEWIHVFFVSPPVLWAL